MNNLREKIKLFRGIGKKIFIWFLLFSLLPLSLSIYQGDTSSSSALKEKIFQQLDTVADYKEYNLIKFLEEREINLSSIVESNSYLFSLIRAVEDKSSIKKDKQILRELINYLAKKDIEDKNGYNLTVI